MSSFPWINNKLSWDGVAQILGVAAHYCPLCHSPRMHVYTDKNYFKCLSCEKTGDFIDWVAQVQHLDPAIAAIELERLGLTRLNARPIWEIAKDNWFLSNHKDKIEFNKIIGVPSLPDSTWKNTLGKYIGWLPKKQAMELHGAVRVSRNQELAVIPMLYGAEWKKSWLFVGVYSHQPYWIAGGTPGLIGLDDWEEPYVFAVESPLKWLQWWCSHLVIESRPLPIISWMDNKDKRTDDETWKNIKKQIIHLPSRINATVVHQLMNTPKDSKLEIVPFKPSNISEWDKIIKKSLPWPERLGTWLKEEATWKQRERLIKELELRHQNTALLSELVPLRYKKTISLFVPWASIRSNKILFENKEIMEEEGKWWFYNYRNYKTLICNVIIRIKNYHEGFVRGDICFDNKAVPFQCSITNFKRAVQNAARKENYNLYVRKTWFRKLVEIALAFRPLIKNNLTYSDPSSS